MESIFTLDTMGSSLVCLDPRAGKVFMKVLRSLK